jgi:hypothetical protein
VKRVIVNLPVLKYRDVNNRACLHRRNHVTASLASGLAMAQSASTSAPAAYVPADIDIGTLLDDPAARAIVDKYVPGFSTAKTSVWLAR